MHVLHRGLDDSMSAFAMFQPKPADVAGNDGNRESP